MSQPKRYIVCPNCKAKLYKEDLAPFFDFNAVAGKLIAKGVLCRICGYKLREVKYNEEGEA